MTPGECPPGGGGRGSAKQEAAPRASLTISLATAAAKLLVGGFFLASRVGVFFLHPPAGWGLLGEAGLVASLGLQLLAW